MSTAQLDKLIVENLADLDSAAKHIDLLETRVWTALAHVIADWSRQSGWAKEIDLDGEFRVRPRKWPDDPQRAAYFQFDWGPDDVWNDGDVSPSFGLSRLAGVGGGRFCLYLVLKRKPKTWRSIARSAAEKFHDLGFALSDYGSFYIDCTLGVPALARAFESGDFEDALAPALKALRAAEAAEPQFTQLLRQADQH